MSELKASELRLDNLVYGPLNEICQVKELGNSLNPNLVGYRELNNLKSWGQNGQKPIPLTESMFIKFKFKKNKYNDGNSIGFEIQMNKFKLICIFWKVNPYPRAHTFQVFANTINVAEIEYVHDLQNLVFSLTKEELTFV